MNELGERAHLELWLRDLEPALAAMRRGQLAEMDRELESLATWAAGEARDRERRHLERRRGKLLRKLEAEAKRAAARARRDASKSSSSDASRLQAELLERPEAFPAEQWAAAPRERPQLELEAAADPSPSPARDGSRRCAWCGKAIPKSKRKDSVCCSTSCRQARHRFAISPAAPTNGRTMRLAYLDPPYPRKAKSCYGTREIDHRKLIVDACLEYPDGWALSTSSDALREVLVLCPPDVRVHVWVNGGRRTKAKHCHDAFEVLIVWRGRVELIEERDPLTNVLAWRGRQHSHPDALPGMKPAAFCEWMFRLLGARAGDELVDVYRGSGSVRRAWEQYTGAVVQVLGDASSSSSTRRVAAGPVNGSRSRLRDAQAKLEASLVDERNA